MKLKIKRKDWTVGLNKQNKESYQTIEIISKGKYLIDSNKVEKKSTKGLFKKKTITNYETEESFSIIINKVEENSISFVIDKNSKGLQPINVNASSNYTLTTNESLKFGTPTEGAGITFELSLLN